MTTWQFYGQLPDISLLMIIPFFVIQALIILGYSDST